MNPGNPSHGSQPEAPHSPGMSLDDVTFTLFRHKWLILGFVCLGIAGMVGMRLVRPPMYFSKAKLMVHYVVEQRAVNAGNPEEQKVTSLDAGAQSAINAEIEILTSLDVVTQVVAMVKPERILAKKGGGGDPMAAAGVVSAGIEVEPPKSSVLTVSFKHPDRDVVGPVLDALIQSYMVRHMEVHNPDLNNYWREQRDEWRRRLGQTEEQLKQLKAQGKVLYLDEAKHTYQGQIAKAEEALMDAQRELAERKAILGNMEASQQTGTNSPSVAIPPEKVSEYGDVVMELDSLKKSERERLRTYTEASPWVQTVRDQIEKLLKEKVELEQAFPALPHLAAGGTRTGTNAFGGDVLSELADIEMLNARVAARTSILSNIQAEAARVMDLEPKITELERMRNEQQASYNSAVRMLDKPNESRHQHERSAALVSSVARHEEADEDDGDDFRGMCRDGVGAGVFNRFRPGPESEAGSGRGAVFASTRVSKHPGHELGGRFSSVSWLSHLLGRSKASAGSGEQGGGHRDGSNAVEGRSRSCRLTRRD